MKILKTVFIALLSVYFFMSCKKEMSFETGTNVTSGTWTFQDSATQYTGTIDSASIQAVNGTKVLTLAGKSLAGTENFKIRLYTTDSFTTTSYAASLSQSEFDYFTSSKTIYKGDFLTGEFIVNITSISGKTITGTFSGVASDSTGVLKQITLGSFVSTINLSNNGGGGQGTPQSVGTLGANPDTCTPVLLAGVFTQGIALTSSNTVQVEVNVTSPGTFIIATNSVNGVNFFKSDTFTTTGVQSVTLTGSGLPINAGVQYYTVTYGGSNCIFPVTFLPGIAPVGDYFPITIGSNWAYGLEGGSTTDSIYNQVITYAPTFNGNVFATITTEDIPPSGTTDSAYYRKTGSDYETHVQVPDYFGLDAPVTADYTFLNDAVPQGTTFQSSTFSGTISGLPVSGFIITTIVEKAVPATVGGISFPDVIKVTYDYYYSQVPTVPLATEERWFARGVGLIYENVDAGNTVYDIGRYTIF